MKFKKEFKKNLKRLKKNLKKGDEKMGKNERTVHCPRCGNIIRRTSPDIEPYKRLGFVVYDARCDKCDASICIEDKSSYEQEGKIVIIYT